MLMMKDLSKVLLNEWDFLRLKKISICAIAFKSSKKPAICVDPLHLVCVYHIALPD